MSQLPMWFEQDGPMGVETPESQEVPVSLASTSPPVEDVEVTPSHADRLQQAVGDRIEEVVKAHTPRLHDLSAIKGAVELSAVRNDAAERRLMTQDYKVHE